MNNETRKQQVYTPEFRGSAVKLAIESDQPVSQTAKELGVNKNTLHTWISKYTYPAKEKSVKTRTDEPIYDENKRLKKELARVTRERDLLKKRRHTLPEKSSEVCLNKTAQSGLSCCGIVPIYCCFP